MLTDELSGITRWAPLAVVLSVVGGFVALSWYAYHAGMQSVKEEDLVVVEADKTPMKEKPADPGGMHIPNQDKTIFDTFSSSGKQPAKVERVLPVPEEPLSKEVDSNEPSTFVNDKLHKAAATEQVIGKDIKKPDTTPAQVPPATDRQVIAAQSPADEDQSVTYVAPHPAPSAPSKALDEAVKTPPTDKRGQPFAPEKLVVSDSTKAKGKELLKDMAKDKETTIAVAKPEPKEELNEAPEEAPQQVEKPVKKEEPKKEEPKKEEEHKEAKAKPESHATETKPSAGGKVAIQLGAYRSEEEARAAWDKMHLKQKELSDKKPTIIRADLGSKGIYFRLRVGGLASASEAKSICSALSSKGQACILPTDK